MSVTGTYSRLLLVWDKKTSLARFTSVFKIISFFSLFSQSAQKKRINHSPKCFSQVDLPYYSPPIVAETGSEIDDSFLVGAFLKGEKNLTKFPPSSGICHQLVPDVTNAWGNFEVHKIFSRNTPLTVAKITSLFSNLRTPQTSGKGISDSLLAASPALPSNKIRIIKIGSIKAVSSL